MVASQFGRQVSEWVRQAEPTRIEGVRQLLRTVDQEQARLWAEQAAARGQHRRVKGPPPDPSTTDTGDSGDAKPGRFGFRLTGRRHRED
jgi:hypothetical protein